VRVRVDVMHIRGSAAKDIPCSPRLLRIYNFERFSILEEFFG
jgi:hypothetical protein